MKVSKSLQDQSRFRTAGPPAIIAERGIGLVITLLVLAIVSGIGSTIIASNLADLQISNNYSHRSVAFYAADSGIETTIRDLRADQSWILQYVDRTTWQVVDPLPTGVVVNGAAITEIPDGEGEPAGYWRFGTSNQLGDGTYQRMIQLPPTADITDGDGTITFGVRARGQGGTVDTGTQVVRGSVELLVEGYGVWDNAIFAGDGQAGNQINGNVAIRGSLHVIGDENNPGVVDFSGTADIRNNYEDAVDKFGATDAAKLPSLTPVEHNGEMVESLKSIIRTQHTDITLDGTAEIGEADASGNGYKETIDSLRTDGSVSPSSQVHSDDWDSYDAESVEFPTLDDPYRASDGSTWNSHREYLQTRSLEIPETEIGPNTGSFSYSDAYGNSIDWDQANQHLTINGIVEVDGNLRLGSLGGQYADRGFEYSGKGTIYANGDVEIDGPVRPSGEYLTGGNLGIIADASIDIDHTAQINIFAALYGEDAVRIAKQTTIAGAVVGRTFDLGNNVPSVFQVPSLATNLPPGMPGDQRIAVIEGARVTDWFQER